MNLTIEQKLTTYNYTDKNDTTRIKYIAIHYYGSLGTAKSVANYFASKYLGASAHYVLDEGDTVYQSVADGDIAWHCGTSGTYYHDECRNSNSLGIEVRPYKLDSSSAYASDTDWYFTDAIIDNLVELTKHLMDLYGIDADHVVRHYDVTHKYCPRPYVGDDTNDYYGKTGNEMWAEFKARLTAEESEEETVTLDEFKELYEQMIAEKKGDDPSDWAEDACEKAKTAGVFVGDGEGNYNWEDPVTRQALAVVMDRAGLLE